MDEAKALEALLMAQEAQKQMAASKVYIATNWTTDGSYWKT